MSNESNKTTMWILLSAGAGLVVGVLLTFLMVFTMMPGMMILEGESIYGFDETVAAVETAVVSEGWVVQSVINMNKSMEKHGKKFAPQVRIIKICQPDYAKSILEGDRQMAVMMPCSLAVYEDDEGRVKISQLNSGLMGTIFGGNVASVMAGKVDPDVKAMLTGILR